MPAASLSLSLGLKTVLATCSYEILIVEFRLFMHSFVEYSPNV